MELQVASVFEPPGSDGLPRLTRLSVWPRNILGAMYECRRQRSMCKPFSLRTDSSFGRSWFSGENTKVTFVIGSWCDLVNQITQDPNPNEILATKPSELVSFSTTYDA